MTTDVYFVSAEPSGDDLAVEVIKELRQLNTSTQVEAIGGKRLQSVGLTSPVDVSPLSVVGFVEGIKIYSEVVKIADEVVELIIKSGARLVVLVDSWGFSIRVADRLKKRSPDIKIVKLVGPQVWATRAGRARTLSRVVDHLLCIHEFETSFYEPYGLPTTVIGNPALDRTPKADGQSFRDKHSIAEDEQIVLILPGSRGGEIKRVGPTFAEVARTLSERQPEAPRICVIVSPSVEEQVLAPEAGWPEGTLFVTDETEKYDCMSAADVALACSGTVTTELAIQGCPMVVGYKFGLTTWVLAKFLFKSDYATLFNVAADKAVAPELIQFDLTAENCLREIELRLTDPAMAEHQRQEQYEALKAMGWGRKPAHKIAAETLAGMLAP